MAEDDYVTTILRLDGSVLTISHEPSGSYRLTLESGRRRRKRIRTIDADLAHDHLNSPAFRRLVEEMKAELQRR